MQNHRKFFINLSHCKRILESLKDHLDCESRSKHSKLHEDLINRATYILDKAASHCQFLASAASKWTMLEHVISEEYGWLQIAHDRIPDLGAVCSTDYLQFMSLYQVPILFILLRSAFVLYLLLVNFSYDANNEIIYAVLL